MSVFLFSRVGWPFGIAISGAPLRPCSTPRTTTVQTPSRSAGIASTISSIPNMP